jgi:hypothetical protein
MDRRHAERVLSHLLGKAKSDIGNLTFGVRDNATDLLEIWMKHPERRKEFGRREINDIAETAIGLNALLDAIKKQDAA